MMNYLMVHQTFTGVRQDFYVYLTRTGTSFSLVPQEIDRPGLILRFGSVLMEAKAGQFIASSKKTQETTLGLRRVGKGPRVKVLFTY